MDFSTKISPTPPVSLLSLVTEVRMPTHQGVALTLQFTLQF